MTVNTNHVAVAPGQIDQRAALWARWIALWNGDLAVAEEILDAGLVSHGRSTPGRGRDGILAQVVDLRAACPGGSFADVPDAIDAQALVVGRWTFRDRAGADPAGTGTDVLRIEAGRIVECWMDHGRVAAR